MRDKSPLIRQWILLRTLSTRHFGATVKELADEMGVSEKTIRRDLSVFQKVGFPLTETVEAKGRKKWRLEPAKDQPGLHFTFDEARALYLGRLGLDPLAGTPFWEEAQRAFQKIQTTFGVRALEYLERFGQMFHYTELGMADYSKKVDIIDALRVGIEDQRSVMMTYQSLEATEPATYRVQPYGLTYHQHALYLVGRSSRRKEIRHWKVDRIEKAETTSAKFQLPKDFDLHKHFAKSFGIFHGDGDVHVKIYFLPTAARHVSESKRHSSQQLTAQNDGSVIAEFDLNHTEEIKRWILSFGSQAAVLEPESLRVEIVEEAKALVSIYV